jgi:hypothetical protein
MTTGLIVFVTVAVLNIAALLMDAVLKWVVKKPTISEHVWEHPALGVPLIAVQVAALVGLAVHLFGGG